MVQPCIANIQSLVKLLESSRQMHRVVQRRLMQEINFCVSYEMCLVSSEPSTPRNHPVASRASLLKSEIENVKADVKASFEETVSALDLFINYLEGPSKETCKKLKQLCDREKRTGNELLTTHKINEIFNFLRSFLIDETKKSQDSNYESFSPEKHSVLEMSPSVNSVSRGASGKELKVNPKNTCIKWQREKQQFTTTDNNHHDRFQDNHHHLMHLSQELRQVQQDSRNKNESENHESYQKRLIKAMEDEINLLKAEKKEILADLGQVTVEKTARENERRKSEFFDRIYRSLGPTSNSNVITKLETSDHSNDNNNSLQNGSHVNQNASTSNVTVNSFFKPQATNENADPGLQSTTSQSYAAETSPPTCRTSNAGSKCRNQQGLIQQSNDGLSFSVQHDYSNERESMSLGNVPSTSVATTLYNNYKLLLLSLGQILLSDDVAKLMSWATQNFRIVNFQNATHVLFQLDENGVINAADLSQLRHFFEAIVRFDLVCVIDAFLLGDYGVLRQITASKKRDVSTTQTPQNGTTRYQNLFNAASNSQFSLRGSSLTEENSNEPHSSVFQQNQHPLPSMFSTHPTPNDAQFLPRSNENQSTAYGATGFTESHLVAVDGPVSNEGRTTTGNSTTNANSSKTSNPRNTPRIASNGSRLSTDGEGNDDPCPIRQNHHVSNEQGDSRERDSASRDETCQSIEARTNSEENNDQRSPPQNHFASNEEGDSRERGLLGQRQSRRNINEEDNTAAQCSNGQTGTLREPLPGESQAHETDTNDQRNPTLAATSSPTASLLIQGIPQSLDEVEVITFLPGIPEALDGYDNRLDVPHTVPSL